MTAGGMGLRIELSGTAVVCCVHDRKKREITTEAQVARLGLEAEVPVLYDRRQHRIYRCTCCDNLFVDTSDEPKRCHLCRVPPVWALGGPLNEPGGPVDG